MATRGNSGMAIKIIGILVFCIGIFLIGILATARDATGDIRSRASEARSCPALDPRKFTPAAVIPSYGLSYPSVVKSGSSYFLFAGGLDAQLASDINKRRPGGYRYVGFQEEIWRFRAADTTLTRWGLPVFSFGILPETSVAFKENISYGVAYPKGFSRPCTGTGKESCNVQINDPSVIFYNGALYMYFSLLENYRWYDGSLGSLSAEGPTQPGQQNIHAIGLAVSGDDGKTWAFVDKVIPETGVSAEVNGKKESVLGAWSPSAVISGDGVDIYYHDALGTKQYVSHLKGGAVLTSTVRLNPFDMKYRVNLDVTDLGSAREILYNDEQFNIVRTVIANTAQYGLCPTDVLVPAGKAKYPTPHQVTVDGKRHLFFWELGNPNVIHHWVRQ
jgi:hypothetical protein